jgi:hypothetical protein
MPKAVAFEALMQMYPQMNVTAMHEDETTSYPIGEEFRQVKELLYTRLVMNADALGRPSGQAALRAEVAGLMRDLGQFLRSDEWVDKMTAAYALAFAEAKALAHG